MQALQQQGSLLPLLKLLFCSWAKRTEGTSGPASFYTPASVQTCLHLQDAVVQGMFWCMQYFMKGYCRNDTDCPFAHGVPDLHGMVVTPTMPPPIPSMPMPSPTPILAPPPPPPQPVRPNYGQAGTFLLSIFRNL